MEAEPSRLRELLEELHAELSRHPPADARGRELLDGLRADMARYDAASGGAATTMAARATDPTEPMMAPGSHSLRGRLQEMALSLEVSHPQLAAAVEQTMVALSNMGL